MTTETVAVRGNPMIRHLMVKQLRDVVWIAALFIAAVAVATGGIAAFTTIRTSAWEVASGIPRWFVGGWGVFVVGVYLPLYIAHGYTRREFARALPAFVAAFSVALGLVMAVGYGLEWIVYRALDWPQEIAPSLLFDAPTQLHLVMLEHTLLFVAWLTAGIMLGAAFYRGSGTGILALPVGVGTVAVIEAFTSRPDIQLVGFLWWTLNSPPLALAAAAYGVGLAVCATLTWRLVRDLPVRSHNT